MKRIFSAILAVVIAVSATLTGCGREAKYSDALRIGASEIPKTLMPYVSSHTSNVYVANMVYDTLLGSISEPADYNLPDGSVYTPYDQDENYFGFTDRLCGMVGLTRERTIRSTDGCSLSRQQNSTRSSSRERE